MADDRLQSAIRSVQMGETSEARQELERIIKADPCNVPAWLWYAETWTSSEQRIQILEACLHVNPADIKVQQALAALTSGRKNTNPPQIVSHPEPNEAKPSSIAAQPTPPVNIAPPRTGSLPPNWEGRPISQLKPVFQNRPKRNRSFNGLTMLSGIAFIGFLVMIGVIAYNSLPADPAKNLHESPSEYYLYVPKNYSADREWPLFVGIHGSGGSGLDCWNWWQSYADAEGFILLCPSIADSGGGWYQADGEAKVFSAINRVRADYRVAPQEFLAGFSAGAQFVQGFTFNHPQYVSGVSVLSAGNYYRPALAARGIPFLIVIGEQDDPTAVHDCQSLVAMLRQDGFAVQYEVLPGVGHAITDKGRELTIALFRKTIGK